MIDKLLIFASLILSVTIILCMIRAIKGPEASDRLVAINVIGTKTIILISMISFILKETYFIDVVLVYALISFIGSVVISHFIEKAGE
ncbi:monovalent cation/H+ antiporter complex subunit F [Inediibacterium massiliense]|uniref:monovalent cation/H+ antiporter complex subunit F n=1 Tax=Inediibacterium massiliense TaxID=1658111 RepID=UPI0006B47189|nr:monovalent cation/H+ antiporter complex subunit F [Inediibacterium massiliense]